ncbi:Isoamylase 2- chloroplastic [Striga hermonthica]|uniref:Isoamylase 2- chloroplastic n=1 Tax=Striga hermonthica TaxID=68872 RepID=A0A9N7RMM4_STRHE|nr:Isoamylase 2- chloroplastic [Striga hermonthica]
MAVVPVLYVMQPRCLSIEAFASSKLFASSCDKYGRTTTSDSTKLYLREKTFHPQLSKHTRRIPYETHVLKALATSDVSVVKTSDHVATYRFMMETGGQLKVLVKRKKNKNVLHVEVESLQDFAGQGDLIMIWGLFRADSTSFMPLDFKRPNKDDKYNTIETPFAKDSGGKLAVELEFEESLTPFYVSILLKLHAGSDSGISTIRTHRKTNFIVPVGFGSGRPFPLGISFSDDGFINFAFFSRSARSVVLCLYANTEEDKPTLEIDLDPYVNRTGDIWHALVDCSFPFVGYGYRCRSGTDKEGPRVLLDPYARVIDEFGSDLPRNFIGKLCKEPAFDWSDDIRPSIAMEKLIIYRLNVTRFTVDKSSKLPGEIAGTFSGISERLGHFKSLGVNAVLLEPIFPFDELKGPYFPWHFFSPRSLYGSSGDPDTVSKSMKEMVKKLHANGIEVFLEVVLTHANEFGQLKQIDSSYSSINIGEDLNCQEALNCNHPVVQQMILESLRYWAVEFHIDGFCFINASSLTKGSRGEFLSRPPLVEAIAFDPLLSKVKIIADSWDPHDMNAKEMAFPHWKRWAEMNTKFCVDVRNILRGQGPISNLATRLCGSGDIFLRGRGPSFCLNFITRNVGLTLVDLVSFSSGGLESECSWNCGEEGPTNNTAVLERRLKQIRNYLFILFISLGVPVLNMGDECGLSSGGSLSYTDRKPLNWNALRSGFGVQMMQFISFLSSLKVKKCDFFQRSSFMKEGSIEWRGVEDSTPDWDDPSCKFLSLTLKGDEETGESTPPYVGGDIFVAFNSGDRSEKVVLPRLAVGRSWVRLVDTGLPFPGFFSADGFPIGDELETYEMKAHSCVLFEVRSL